MAAQLQIALGQCLRCRTVTSFCAAATSCTASCRLAFSSASDATRRRRRSASARDAASSAAVMMAG